jgi:hypothetical protein
VRLVRQPPRQYGGERDPLAATGTRQGQLSTLSGSFSAGYGDGEKYPIPAVARKQAETGESPVLLANFGLDEASDVDDFARAQHNMLSICIFDRRSCDAADHDFLPPRRLARHHRPHLRQAGRTFRPRGVSKTGARNFNQALLFTKDGPKDLAAKRPISMGILPAHS